MKLTKEQFEMVMAFLWSISCIGFLFVSATGWFKAPDTVISQEVQGIFGIAMLITGYYWGASKSKTPPPQDPPSTPQ